MDGFDILILRNIYEIAIRLKISRDKKFFIPSYRIILYFLILIFYRTKFEKISTLQSLRTTKATI